MTKGQWIEYTGSDEQIAEMKHGFIFLDVNKEECRNVYYGKSFVGDEHLKNYLKGCEVTHYWIIPYDPLREMKIRQAMTGQPVYYKYQRSDEYGNLIHNDYEYGCTYQPNWYHPNTEYSFTPFEEK